MEHERADGRVTCRFQGDFNVVAVREIAPLVAEADEVVLDLSAAKLVDTEAIRALYGMVAAGQRVTLVRPPMILYKVVRVLGLEGFFDLDQMVVNDP